MNSRFIHVNVVTELPSAKIFITDKDYALPSRNWLEGSFYKFFSNWLFSQALHKWNEQFDCDNFASLYYNFAQIYHYKTQEKLEQGLAVGEMFYRQDSGGGHAINIAVDNSGVFFIEPQNGKIKKLSHDEKNSCWFVRF